MNEIASPSFNLWNQAWITLERHDGSLGESGIESCLLRADQYRAIYNPSPLVVVGIHRLLAAILQDALRPQRPADLRRLWLNGRFPEEQLRAFGERYAHRFELFSVDEPFLQSCDLPLAPPKGAKGLKSVAYLVHEIPAGSEVTHYRHSTAAPLCCSTCAARGLVAVPAFATSGGAGIKPSINGVPPLYVIPGGATLFEHLAASLVLPGYQPAAATREDDAVWWRHAPTVPHKATVRKVSYLHSLTFPARRIRLHPEPMGSPCARCGAESQWGVRTMIFQMGESRPKDAPFWQDPFVAYKKRGENEPVPIRPVKGKALWREFGALFLPSREGGRERTFAPSVLFQTANERLREDVFALPFRCIGMRTDMKAKVFEWLDADFDVPLELVNDVDAGILIQDAIDFSTDCSHVLSTTFRQHFGGGGQSERHKALRLRMVDDYWAALSIPFRDFVLNVAETGKQEPAYMAWVDQVVTGGKRSFEVFSEMTGRDAVTLRQRVQARKRCAIRLNTKRKEQTADDASRI